MITQNLRGLYENGEYQTCAIGHVLNERRTGTAYDHEGSRDRLIGQQKHSEVKHF